MRNLAAAFCISLIVSPAGGFAADLNSPEGQGATPSALTFGQIARACAPSIHIRTLASLVRQESQLNAFAININGAQQLIHQPATQEEALKVSRDLLARGYNIDVGLGQINSRNFRDANLPLTQLFDPCENLRAVEHVLSDCYARGVAMFGPGQTALHAALSCYNTGSLTHGIENGYVQHVMARVALPVPELLPMPQSAGVTSPLFSLDNQITEPPTLQKQDVMSRRSRSEDGDVFLDSEDADAFSSSGSKEDKNARN
jgi:type IV secretion system protein VirB1